MEKTLSAFSQKDKPWRQHKSEAERAREILFKSPSFRSRSERMSDCGKVLQFGLFEAEGQESHLHLLHAKFCHVRGCPICEWRRSLLWKSRLLNALPSVMNEAPKNSRWIFLTLTVKNCSLSDLRTTLKEMSSAWNRFRDYELMRDVVGWVRKTEITRGADGTAHPHFHVLALVRPEYFKSGYVTQAEWADGWKRAMRLDYTPVVDVRIVKNRKIELHGKSASLPLSGIKETLKYTTKFSQLLSDENWFLNYLDQIKKLRLIATGGLLKNILKDDNETDDDFINVDEISNEEKKKISENILIFFWSGGKKGNYFLQEERFADDRIIVGYLQRLRKKKE